MIYFRKGKGWAPTLNQEISNEAPTESQDVYTFITDANRESTTATIAENEEIAVSAGVVQK